MLGAIDWKYLSITSNRHGLCIDDHIFSIIPKYLIIADIILLIAAFDVIDFIIKVEI